MKRFLPILFLALLAGPALAAPPYVETPIGHQATVTLATATALTPTAGAIIADITVEANATYTSAVRCWTDGTAPTASAGLEILAGGSLRVVSSNLTNVKCIQEAASGAIDVQYAK